MDVLVTIPNEPILEGVVAFSDTFTLTATSQLSNVIRSQANGTTQAVLYPSVKMGASQGGEGHPGSQVSYNFVLTNTGANSDAFQLSVASSWVTNLSMESTGDIAVGEAVSLTLVVDIPKSAVDGETEPAVLTAVSCCDRDVSTSTSALTTARWFRYYFPLGFRYVRE